MSYDHIIITLKEYLSNCDQLTEASTAISYV